MSITKLSCWGYADEFPGGVSYKNRYINCGIYYNPGPLIGVKLRFALSEINERMREEIAILNDIIEDYKKLKERYE